MRAEFLALLPPEAEALADSDEFQLSPAWFGAIAEAALPGGARPLFLMAHAAGRVRAVLPLVRYINGRLAGLTTPYTSVFRPLVAGDASPAELHAAGRAFARACRTAGPLRLDALDAAWHGLGPLLAGMRAGLMVPLRFAQFGNWHADGLGEGWGAYLATRPSGLRNTIQRKLARAARDPAISFAIVRGGGELEAGIAAYEAVYSRSWKTVEPFPRFPATLMRAAAMARILRLGLLRRADEPLAAQIWVVAGGAATVHKLAHDEAARAASPGTVLTALMIRHLLDTEHVTRLDFGRGDDAYKAGWTGQRRQRIGVLLCPPWHPTGAGAIARHLAGQVWRHFAPAGPVR